MISSSLIDRIERKQSKLLDLGLEIKHSAQKLIGYIELKNDYVKFNLHNHIKFCSINEEESIDHLKKLCDTYNDILFSKDGE